MDPTATALLAAFGGQGSPSGGLPSITGRPASSDAMARSDGYAALSNFGNVNFAAKQEVWVWALIGVAFGAVVAVAVWPRKG